MLYCQYHLNNFFHFETFETERGTIQELRKMNVTKNTYATQIWKNLWIIRAALSNRFHSRVELTISNSLRVGNCFLNFSSICAANYKNVEQNVNDRSKFGAQKSRKSFNIIDVFFFQCLEKYLYFQNSVVFQKIQKSPVFDKLCGIHSCIVYFFASVRFDVLLCKMTYRWRYFIDFYSAFLISRNTAFFLVFRKLHLHS